MSAAGPVDAALAAEAVALAGPTLRALLARPGVSGERVARTMRRTCWCAAARSSAARATYVLPER